MILIIDNYDSFTYNLFQYIAEITNENREIRVIRNDALSVEDIFKLAPQHIVISPGPCTPNEAGNSLEVIQAFAGKIPILGVCLGHQAIAQAFGAKIVRAAEPMHGKTTLIRHCGKGIFSNLQNNFVATRYHSLVVEKHSLPSCLEVIAWSSNDEIMAIRHRTFENIIGVQFHPESILTTVGKELLSQFLQPAVSNYSVRDL